MPICIICLVVALVCTCTRYKKAKQSPQTADSKTGGNLLPQTSIHHLPLPPIPTSTDVEENAAGYYEYTSELNVEANRAYGTNLTNDAKDRAVYETSMTTDANRAYGSNLTTEPDRSYYEVNSVTEADQAYELDDIGVTGSDSYLKREENRSRAYGSNLTTEPDGSYEVNSVTEADQAYELDDIVVTDLKTEENRAYGSKLSAECVNKAAASSQSTTAHVHVRAPVIPTEENIAYGQHNQLAEETDMYEYI